MNIPFSIHEARHFWKIFISVGKMEEFNDFIEFILISSGIFLFSSKFILVFFFKFISFYFHQIFLQFRIIYPLLRIKYFSPFNFPRTTNILLKNIQPISAF